MGHSAGEIAGVVIIIVVFLALGVFACGCGPLPQPTEIAAAQWRERKERREARQLERAQRREAELPLHRTPSQTRNRAIKFADDCVTVGDTLPSVPAAQLSLPSPPPPCATRNRSPTPQLSRQSARDSDASLSSHASSVLELEDLSVKEVDEKVTEDLGRPGDERNSTSIHFSKKDNVVCTTPIHSVAPAKE